MQTDSAWDAVLIDGIRARFPELVIEYVPALSLPIHKGSVVHEVVFVGTALAAAIDNALEWLSDCSASVKLFYRSVHYQPVYPEMRVLYEGCYHVYFGVVRK